MIKKFVYTVIAVILFVMGKDLLAADFTAFLQWWFVILGLGIIFLPLTNLIFQTFRDKGYLFSKTIGIAVTGYIMWLLASLRLLKFTTVSCILAVGIGLLLNLLLILYYSKLSKNRNDVNRQSLFGFCNMKVMDEYIKEELLFFALFLFFTYIRGFKPEAYGTEKFMDYGFMTTMMRSDYMPPQDFWFSGTPLNYYYVGQFLATFLTRVSFVEVSQGYNLMLMMIGAFAFVLPFSIVYNLILKYYQGQKRESRFVPQASGLLAGLGVCIAGNMHYPVYKWFIPAVQWFLHREVNDYYWFPNATRYIGYNPETSDKTIHEFPAYSFVLGDLHAHVINILFVLTVLGILLAWLNTREAVKDKETIVLKEVALKKVVLKEILHPAIIMIGFFIGLFHTTNFWDFPIYYVVSGAVILFSNMVVYNFKGKAFLVTAMQGVFVLGMGLLIALPFTINFKQITTGINLADAHTPLYQLLVLWGLPIITVLAFLIFLITNSAKKRQISNKNNRKAKAKSKSKHSKDEAAFVQFMKELSDPDLYIITIGLCAIGLVLLPEIMYVEDIYSGDYRRANTMFKLTYQAFIMFGICFGYILPRLLRFGRTNRQKLMAGISLVLVIMSFFYVGNAVKAWYGNIFDKKGYEGIDAAAFMKKEMPEDYYATNWLNQNVSGTPVVLEANGDSYTDYQRVSVITGLPTVLGWYTHERLWKSEPGRTDRDVTDILNERAGYIQTIYTSDNEEEVKALIQKFNISYIYVGKLEQDKYEAVNHGLLKKLGQIVYEDNDSKDKYYETYIIKIAY
ncbi:hypothetical protein I5677_02210 [Mobilitalea sibirica]|uniref:Chlor_Arch_YYY domain-containing protein n=1 Tax=Mobilitalea sibirica TaxID=1462919 RepID=A0A8J7H4V4_9FIRM|nr:DUF2298 domain-containing protein [Mobilitalea sibirica]MBH1939706.1 hypothetical protein [Mobilitalea sibirica]